MLPLGDPFIEAMEMAPLYRDMRESSVNFMRDFKYSTSDSCCSNRISNISWRVALQGEMFVDFNKYSCNCRAVRVWTYASLILDDNLWSSLLIFALRSHVVVTRSAWFLTVCINKVEKAMDEGGGTRDLSWFYIPTISYWLLSLLLFVLIHHYNPLKEKWMNGCVQGKFDWKILCYCSPRRSNVPWWTKLHYCYYSYSCLNSLGMFDSQDPESEPGRPSQIFGKLTSHSSWASCSFVVLQLLCISYTQSSTFSSWMDHCFWLNFRCLLLSCLYV